MRFVTYQFPDDPARADRVGLLHDGAVHRLRGVAKLLDLLGDDGSTLHAAGEAALSDPEEVLGTESVRLRAPIPRPPSMRDFMTFAAHVEGAWLNYGADSKPPKVWYRQPLFYFSNPAAIMATGDDVPLPPGSRSFDFELEVGAFIGREGANLTVEEAADYIVGYTILNDWSARDLQFFEMQGTLGPAKGKDTATTIGPAFVTADELAPFASGPSFDLGMEVDINGERFGADRLDNMAWSFGQMVAYASRGTRLMPGDLFGTGTCGNGCITEYWGRHGGGDSYPSLQAGDVVTMRVDQLGEITNRVVDAQPVHDIGTSRAISPYS
jgi:2-keto-4-pentenoate hydratase/2-oxohepta-3-ene-1,7-dioic acid hydratase in catechol pathway